MYIMEQESISSAEGALASGTVNAAEIDRYDTMQ